MRDIGSIIALTLHDKGLRPEHVFDGAELDRNAEHVAVARVPEPFVIDRREPVATAEDQIHEYSIGKDLAQKVRMCDFGVVSGCREDLQRPIDVTTRQKD